MLNDDPVNAKGDCLVDHIRLQSRILAAVKDTQVDTKRFSLLFHARKIGLEEVACRKIAHKCDFHVLRLVEGCGHVGCKRTAAAKTQAGHHGQLHEFTSEHIVSSQYERRPAGVTQFSCLRVAMTGRK